MDTIDLVSEFHSAYGIPKLDKPGIPSRDRCELRIRLLREELDEFERAILCNDPVGVLDALSDIQYVLDGAYIEFGMKSIKNDAVSEVHRSNMTKLGDDGKPVVRNDGKILKGPRFTPPNLKPLVSQ